MILEAHDFPCAFKLPPQVGRARQILIKPCAGSPQPYPTTTSRDILEAVISKITELGEATIILLEGCPQGDPMQHIYRTLRYDFPHIVVQDVQDCVLVEIENPLPRPFITSAFWLPNVLLYCDYLITICPLKTSQGQGSLAVENLLGLLSARKYPRDAGGGWGGLNSLGLHKVIADLYFTLPFDLGLIDARRRCTGTDNSAEGKIEDYNRFFVGDPFEIDKEVSQALGLEVKYLQFIESAKAQLKAHSS